MNRNLTAGIRKLVVGAALALSVTGAAAATSSSPVSAGVVDDTYNARFLSGSHQAYVTFSGSDAYGYVTIRDGAGDSYCSAVEYRGTFSNGAWRRLPAVCGGRTASIGFALLGWSGSVDFRPVTGNYVGSTITCWRGTDDVDRNGVTDFCS